MSNMPQNTNKACSVLKLIRTGYQLEPEQRIQLLSGQRLTKSAWPRVDVQSTSDVLNILGRCNLLTFKALVTALPSRFENVAIRAAEMCQLKVQFVSVPRRIMKSLEEIGTWAEESKDQLKVPLAKGPVANR